MSIEESNENNLLIEDFSCEEKNEETHSIYLDTLIEKDESLFIILKHVIGSILSQIIFGICYISFYVFIIIYIKMYGISTIQASLIINIFNLGQILEPFAIAYINQYIDKVKSLTISGIVISLLYLIEGYFNSLFIICLNRLLMGVISVIILTNSYIITIEFLPKALRGTLMSLTGIGQRLGPIFVLLLFYFYDNALEASYSEVKKILVITSVFCFLLSLYYIIFIEEGPRDLILRDKLIDARYVLESLHKRKISDVQMGKIVNEVKLYCHNDDYDSHKYSRLFENASIRKITLQVSGIKLLSSLFISGLALAVSIFVSETKWKDNEQATINDLIVISITQLPVIFIAFLSDIPIIGRLGMLRIGNVLSIIFCLVLFFYSANFSLFVGLSSLFMGAVSITIINYTNEIYPNDLRSIGIYFSIIPDSLGVIFSQLIYAYLSNYGLNTVIIFSLCVALLNLVLSLMLNKESRGERLGHAHNTKTELLIVN